MKFEAVKYKGVWCLYDIKSEVYHFNYKGKKANQEAAKRLDAM